MRSLSPASIRLKSFFYVLDDLVADVSGRYRDMLIKGVQKELDDLVPPDARNSCNVVTRVVTGRALTDNS